MNEKVLTIVLFVALGVQVVLGGTAVWYYQFMVIPELDQQIDARKATRKEMEDKRAQIKPLEKKIKDLTEEIARISAQIPPFDGGKKENDDFANLVDKIRKKSRVGIGDAKYINPTTSAPTAAAGGPPALPAGIFKATYDFKVGGGFHSLLNFLFHLENDGRFVTVDKIQMVAGSKEEKGGLAIRALAVTLSTYLARPEAPPAPAGAPAGAGAGAAKPPGPTPSPTPAPTPTPAPEKKTTTPSPD